MSEIANDTVDPLALEPITDDDATIAAALDDLSIPTLMLSMVHMTGDPSIIRDADLRPHGCFLNEVQGFMTPEEQAEVRRRALEVITAFRDAGSTPVHHPGPDLVREMMSWLVCEDIPGEYVPMMLEELGLDHSDQRRLDWSDVDADAKAHLPVVVIGAGMSGLLAGVRLAEAGVPFTIVEKNPAPGGTWYENTYPGARVDVGNHFYCYSFEPSDHWTEFFSRQPELQRYFADVVDRYGLEAHIRWETEVTAAAWSEEGAAWTVTVRDADGRDDHLTARAVIAAVGQLNRPRIPDFAGRDDFEGPAFHSARWDHSVDLAGRDVALVGAGASGFQIAPTIAPEVGRLTVYQRTAQWMFPNPHYHEEVGDGVRWALRHLPGYGRWFRFLIMWPGCDGGLVAARIDPGWEDDGRSISAANDLARQMFTEWIAGQVGDDPDLLEKVIPDYPATGKRTLQDNGSWLAALRRDDVELVRDPIDHFVADGIVTADGTHRHHDVVVFATGFWANRFLWPMTIEGRDGRVLAEQWGDTPSAHLGITVPGFPNLFLMYGPGTNLASGGSIIFHAECQMRYIEGCLHTLAGARHRAMEPTQAAHDDWLAHTQAELDQMVWSHPSVTHSWYKADDGRIYGLSPWRLVDYWTWTRAPDLDDFVVTD